MSKKTLPIEIQNDMKLYRFGLTSIPNSYIVFQHELANEALSELIEKYGFFIHSAELKFDGWGDGMRVLHVCLETKSNNQLKIYWHDGNQEFFCGSVQLNKELLK